MNHSLNLADLGRRVRAARVARGLTLEEVVSRTDFTVSWLSKLENGQLSPSLEGLVKIAAVLECGVDSFVAGLAATPRHVVCRNGTAAGPQARDGVTVEHRAAAWRGRRMKPAILHVSRSAGRRAPESGAGERFLIVLEGDAQVTYGDEVVRLAAGDSIYMDAAVPHAITAVGRSARILSVSCDADGRPTGPGAGRNGPAARARLTVCGRSRRGVCPARPAASPVWPISPTAAAD